MVFMLTLEWARRCFKKTLDGKPCTIETQILHKTSVTLCTVVNENQNQIIFPLLLERKKHPKTRVDWLFFDHESVLHLFQQWEKCKNHRNGCCSCYKASCQVLNQKILQKKSNNSFYIAWS